MSDLERDVRFGTHLVSYIKYNYTIENFGQDYDSQEALLEISKDGLTLNTLQESKCVKNKDLNPAELNKLILEQPKGKLLRLYQKKVKSSSSFRFDEIKSFMFGGFSSRFWGLRKHINCL